MRNEPMRIENLRVTPIALGDPPLLNAAGLHAPYAIRIVIELETEAGIVGLSEIPGDAEVLSALSKSAPGLAGVSVHDARSIERRLRETIGKDAPDARGDRSYDGRRFVHVLSAIEVACLDAVGKRWDCRVADLLGGVARTRVPYAGYLFFKYGGAGGALGFGSAENETGWSAARQAPALDADGIVTQARAMMNAFGFTSLKLKAGILEPDVEVGAALALRDAFGTKVPIRVDPNAVWSFDTALAQGRRLLGAVEYLEDPVRGREAMARFRRELDLPLATNMCTTGDGPVGVAGARCAREPGRAGREERRDRRTARRR
jgi:glucarate dehydratase